MQTTRIPLPEDPAAPGVEQWAEIRDVSTLRAGDAKAIRKAVKLKLAEDGSWDHTFTPGDTDDRVDALLVRVITAWSYSLPLPVADRASLDEIPIDAWEALRDATAPHLEALDFTRPRSRTDGGASSASRTTSEDATSPATNPTTT